ncbi:MAG: hypothetical protein JNM25_07605 [Planctomycetes bacterium]|nr:hypothetical protein [Planctomycetota bacterium]
MSARVPIASFGALLLAACGGVHHAVHREVPAPKTVAVLPFAGPADASVRDGARALFASRLRARGYQTVELAWTDRVLTEHGWLRDPARFDASALPLRDVATALGVEALVLGHDFDESSFNIWLLRRHSFGGLLALQHGDGRTYWSANHAAATQGGFLLTSGQVFTELRAQGEHGTAMATLALVDEFTADVADTVPQRDAAPRTTQPPELRDASVAIDRRPDGTAWLVVEARSSAGVDVRCDVGTLVGVPMVAARDATDRYRCERELPRAAAVTPIVLRARSRFGDEARLEVQP